MKKSEIGKIGEEIATKYLQNIGYLIITRNYWKKFGEIDIIAKSKNSKLIFVEVKTIKIGEDALLKPEDNFTTQKYKKVNRICQFFAADHPELIDEEMGWQLDLIAIEISMNGRYSVRHYENI